MNNKGQSLILFVLVMPILVGFLAFFIDISMVNYEKSRIDGIIINNLEIVVDKDIRELEKIKNVFIDNSVNVKDISINDDVILVEIDTNLKSIFGRILNFDMYRLKTIYKGNYLEKSVDKVG